MCTDMKVSFISYLHLEFTVFTDIICWDIFSFFCCCLFFRRCLSRCPHWTWHWNPANGFKRCSVSHVEVLDASCQFQIVWPHSSRAKMKKLHSNHSNCLITFIRAFIIRDFMEGTTLGGFNGTCYWPNCFGLRSGGRHWSGQHKG